MGLGRDDDFGKSEAWDFWVRDGGWGFGATTFLNPVGEGGVFDAVALRESLAAHGALGESIQKSIAVRSAHGHAPEAVSFNQIGCRCHTYEDYDTYDPTR